MAKCCNCVTIEEKDGGFAITQSELGYSTICKVQPVCNIEYFPELTITGDYNLGGAQTFVEVEQTITNKSQCSEACAWLYYHVSAQANISPANNRATAALLGETLINGAVQPFPGNPTANQKFLVDETPDGNTGVIAVSGTLNFVDRCVSIPAGGSITHGYRVRRIADANPPVTPVNFLQIQSQAIGYKIVNGN